MRNRILVIAGIAALIIGATVLGLAQGQQGYGDRMRGGGPEEMIEHIARELNLTDAQKGQAKAILEAQKAIEDERHAKLEDIHKQIEAATANGQFDEALVRPLANQEAQLKADEMVDHLRMHAKLYSLLTAEQRTKADQMMKRHGEGGEHRRGPGPGHGPPPPPPGF
jgi:protein CpxP